MLKKIVLPVIAVLALALLIAACGGDDNDAGDGGIGEEPTVSTADDGGGGEEPTVSLEEPAVPFAESCQKTDEKQFAAAPERIIDTSKTYIATIKMENGGEIVVELNSSVPITTNNFVFLACKGYYDGLTFHRAESGFVIQGGDPAGNGTGGPGYGIPPEFEGSVFETGVIGMARSAAPDSAGSQFYIMLGRAESLDGDYASFGRVTSGMDVVQQIVIGDVMETITIEER